MNVLVTGASGFLGGVLARRLVEQGDTVRVLVRETSNLTHLLPLAIDIVTGCLEDRRSLDEAVEKAETIYHCAAVSTDWAPWKRFYSANVQGVENLLDAAVAAGVVKRFLHVSTTDVYGYPHKACDESHPLTDVGLPYNRSKVRGEHAVWRCSKETGLPVTVIRPVTIYGPRGKDFVVEIANLLINKEIVYINKGRSHSGLLYVHNAVDAIIEASRSRVTIGQAYNLRDESDETWADYVGGLAERLGVSDAKLSLPAGVALFCAWGLEKAYGLFRVHKRPLLTRHAVYLLCRDQGFAIHKAKRDLGFTSVISFDEAMARTMRWLDSDEGRDLVPR
jgi:nucleoside-diphosphate-sugar epimerase